MKPITMNNHPESGYAKRAAMDLAVAAFSLAVGLGGFFHREVTFLMVGI